MFEIACNCVCCAQSSDMKRLFLLSILLSCKSGPRKVSVAHHAQVTNRKVAAVKHDTSSSDMHVPYRIGKDTVRLNKAMDKIFKFAEVEAITKQINKISKGKHSASKMVYDELMGTLPIIILWSARTHMMIGMSTL